MALFCIQGTSPCNMQAFQVDRVSLSSGNNLQGGGFLSGLQRMKIAWVDLFIFLFGLLCYHEPLIYILINFETNCCRFQLAWIHLIVTSCKMEHLFLLGLGICHLVETMTFLTEWLNWLMCVPRLLNLNVILESSTGARFYQCIHYKI